MRLKIIAFLLLGVISARAQVPTATVRATLLSPSGAAQAGQKITYSNVTLNGQLINLGPVTVTSTAYSSANVSNASFVVPRGAYVNVECNVAGFNVPGGYRVIIPDSAIHQIGGVVAAAIRLEYTVTFLAIQ